MLALGRACGHRGVLSDDQRGALGHLAPASGLSRSRELLEVAGHMHDGGLARVGSRPRHRCAQRVVHLKGGGSVAPDTQPAQEPMGKRVLGKDRGQGAGTDRRHHIASRQLFAAAHLEAHDSSGVHQDPLHMRLAANGDSLPRRDAQQRARDLPLAAGGVWPPM